MDDWSKVRPTIEMLARDRRCRINDFTREIPCDWSPGTVVNPESEMPFTGSGAWEFICQVIASGHPFSPVAMQKPPDSIAYETVYDFGANVPRLYIKIQLLKGKVYGRSFHNELRTQK